MAAGQEVPPACGASVARVGSGGCLAEAFRNTEGNLRAHRVALCAPTRRVSLVQAICRMDTARLAAPGSQIHSLEYQHRRSHYLRRGPRPTDERIPQEREA